MTAIITAAGRAWLAGHLNAGSSPEVTSVELGTGSYTPTGAETKITTPFSPRKQFTISTVERLIAGQVGIKVLDSSRDDYSYSERGVWGNPYGTLTDDVLVAIEAVPDGVINTKAAALDLAMAIAIPFSAADIANLTWRVTTPLPATESTAGLVEFSDGTEAVDESVADRALSPKRAFQTVRGWWSDVTGADIAGKLSGIPANSITGILSSSQIPNLPASKITSGVFNALRIPNLSASKITTGVLNVLRIPNLPASKITSGTLDVLRIPDLAASKITSGVFDIDRIPDIPSSKVTGQEVAASDIPDLPASKITTGVFNALRIPNLSGNKIVGGRFTTDQIPDLPANKITSGVFGLLRIPNLPFTKITGTASASQIPSLNASKIGAGTFAEARIPDSVKGPTIINTSSVPSASDVQNADIGTIWLVYDNTD